MFMNRHSHKTKPDASEDMFVPSALKSLQITTAQRLWGNEMPSYNSRHTVSVPLYNPSLF